MFFQYCLKRTLKTRLSRQLLLLFLLFCLSGCRLQLHTGRYEGSLLQQTHTEILSQPVSMELNRISKREIQIEVKDAHRKVIETAKVTWPKDYTLHLDSIKVFIPRISPKPFKLFRNKTSESPSHWECFSGESAFFVDTCFDHQRFFIRITHPQTHNPIYTLSGEMILEQPPVEMETPSDFSLSQAVTIAMSKNFATRAEFEKVRQTQAAMKAAFLNLLPHFNYKSAYILNIFNPMVQAVFVGDYLPFLLPTRWFKALEAKEESKAEKITYDLMRADLALQVQTLAYSLDEARSNHQFFENLNRQLGQALDHVNQLGNHGPTRDRLTVFIKISELERIRFEALMKTTKNALSLSLGFHNPETINDLTIGPEVNPVDTAVQLEKEPTAYRALHRALELKQLDHLLDLAHYRKDEFYFNWADPEVASTQSVSLGVIQLIKLSKSVIKVLFIRREEIQSTILQKVHLTVENYNKSIESYRVAFDNFIYIRNIMDNLMNRIVHAKPGNDFVLLQGDLQFVIQNYINAILKLNSTISNFRSQRAQLDRLLLEGFYGKLVPEQVLPVLDPPEPVLFQ